MYLLAASYLGYAALFVYVEFRGPDLPGVHFPSAFAPGPAIIGAVTPGSPADRAGLQQGDRLIEFNGRPTPDTLMWYYALGASHAGRPYRVQIERDGQPRQVSLTLEQRPTGFRRTSDWVRFARAALALGLAIVIAFSRPFDLQARVGAWLLAEVGLFGLFFLNTGLAGMEAAWRDLPWPVVLILGAPLVSPGGALLFAFASIFPRPFFRGRWAWTLVLAPQIAVMAMRAYYHLSLGLRLPGWLKPVGAMYFIAAIIVFVLNYRRLDDRNQQRRARVVAIGAAALVVAVLPYVIMLSPGVPVADLERVLMSPGVFVSLNVLSAAFPISIAYAILRHRAFDISVVIRQGLKYAVARRTVTAALPALGAILAADLLMHGDQPLTNILRERGWVYAALGGVALLAQRRQRDWMDSLDRRFFREKYDAQRLLREVAEQVRNAGTFEGAATRVTAQIEASLHTEFSVMLMRHPGEPSYTAVAASPAGAGPPALPAGSKLLALFRVLDKPMNLSLTDTGWLQQLPGDETDFLRQARIEWLIPIATKEGRTEALLAVGFKRSEEPYTREDQDLLLTIAASMALLLDRAPMTVTIPAGERSDSRVLAGRYRLEDRLGAGGMGTVYAATDTALQRRVAIKLMRDELVGNSTAAERFRREARVAAAFSHPNVVTVHDFGVASGSRAFLVMEILEGVDLRAELTREHHLTARRVIDLLRGVCSGLEAAHRRDLLHRDIKPENIFLARSASTETPKILDFGIAKFVAATETAHSTTATATGHVIGTLRYMSPEQLRGEPASVRWDLWSLAVVAYEMLSGEYPFDGASMAEWHAAVLAGRSIPLARQLTSAPGAWQTFFTQVLAPDPLRRPQSASEFFTELEKSLAVPV